MQKNTSNLSTPDIKVDHLGPLMLWDRRTEWVIKIPAHLQGINLYKFVGFFPNMYAVSSLQHEGQVMPMVSLCLLNPFTLQTEIETVGILQESQKDPDETWKKMAKQIIHDYIEKEIRLTWEATEKFAKGQILDIPYTASFITIQTLMLEQRGYLDEHSNN